MKDVALGPDAIAGYTIINAASMDEATEIAKGCPALQDDPEGAVRVYEAMPM